MNCKICGALTDEAFKAEILNKYDVQYYSCPECEYLCTEEPYWLNEAYSRAINLSDTGLVDRNIYFSKVVSVLVFFFFNRQSEFIDYAGGYGLFTRLMRDTGFDFYWHDPFCENLFATGFEYTKDKKRNFEIVTAFEVFEHFSDPVNEMNNLVSLSPSIVFSTELTPHKIPLNDWWYYGFNHGQHISFYSPKTLKTIARKFNMNVYSVSGIHIFTRKNLSPILLKLILPFAKRGLSAIVKNIMKSKTWDDHLLLKEQK